MLSESERRRRKKKKASQLLTCHIRHVLECRGDFLLGARDLEVGEECIGAVYRLRIKLLVWCRWEMEVRWYQRKGLETPNSSKVVVCLIG